MRWIELCRSARAGGPARDRAHGRGRSGRAQRRGGAIVTVVTGLVLAGCIPTLSQPRGAAHLDAMAEGGRHHAHGRDEEAARAYASAAEHAERRVDRDEAEWREAQAHRRMGRLDEALAILDRIAARRPIARRTVRAIHLGARLRLERGERDPAIAALRTIVFEHPSEGPASRSLVLLLDVLPERDGDALLEELDRDVRESDLHDDVLMLRAERALSRGERDAARRLFARVPDEHPYPRGERWDDSLWRLADLAEEDGDPSAAIAHLVRMIEPQSQGISPGSYTLPRMPDAALRIARLQRDALRDHEAALASFERVEHRFPTSRVRDDARVERGELELSLDRREAGCATLHGAIASFEVGAAVRRAREIVARSCR